MYGLGFYRSSLASCLQELNITDATSLNDNNNYYACLAEGSYFQLITIIWHILARGAENCALQVLRSPVLFYVHFQGIEEQPAYQKLQGEEI